MTTKPNSGTVSVSRELLPCPFCGSDESLQIEHLEGTVRHPAFRVRCDNCGASTGYTDTGHIEAWNTRAQTADQQGEPVGWTTPGMLSIAKDVDGPHSRFGARTNRSTRFCVPLYLSAWPATAKVVLPERTTDTQSCSDVAKRIGLYGSVNVWQLGEIWNACLDEVAKLNGINT